MPLVCLRSHLPLQEAVGFKRRAGDRFRCPPTRSEAAPPFPQLLSYCGRPVACFSVDSTRLLVRPAYRCSRCRWLSLSLPPVPAPALGVCCVQGTVKNSVFRRSPHCCSRRYLVCAGEAEAGVRPPLTLADQRAVQSHAQGPSPPRMEWRCWPLAKVCHREEDERRADNGFRAIGSHCRRHPNNQEPL